MGWLRGNNININETLLIDAVNEINSCKDWNKHEQIIPLLDYIVDKLKQVDLTVMSKRGMIDGKFQTILEELRRYVDRCKNGEEFKEAVKAIISDKFMDTSKITPTIYAENCMAELQKSIKCLSNIKISGPPVVIGNSRPRR